MEPHQVKALEFKAAVGQALDACPLPSKALADVMEVAYSTLRAWADPSIDLHIPSHRLPRLLSLTPDLSIVRYLASLQGAVVVPVPKAGTPDRCQLGHVMLEFSHLLNTHAEATSNGEWEPHEVTALQEIAARLHACVSAQVLYAERQVQPTVRRIDEKRRA